MLIEGLALGSPRPTIAATHRRASEVAAHRAGPVPSHRSVHAIVTALDPGLVALAHEGAKPLRQPGSEVSRKPRQVIRPGDGTLYGDARTHRATVRAATVTAAFLFAALVIGRPDATPPAAAYALARTLLSDAWRSRGVRTWLTSPWSA